MKARVFLSLILVLTLIYIAFPLSAQESKDTRKALDSFVNAATRPVAGAGIMNVRAITVQDSGPAEKTQFDVILKSVNKASIKTNKQGIF